MLGNGLAISYVFLGLFIGLKGLKDVLELANQEKQAATRVGEAFTKTYVFAIMGCIGGGGKVGNGAL